MVGMIETETEIILSDAEVEAGNLRGDEIFDELGERIGECHEDTGVIIFSLWLKLMYELFSYGWSSDDLGKEVITHEAIYESEGTA